jgi:type I restriction enzyme S subunit
MSHALNSTSETWLGTAPSSWRVDRLKDIVPQILGGGTPSSSDPDSWDDGDIIWITPTDFSRSSDKAEIADSERRITSTGLRSCSATLLPKGTVIMSSRATIGTARIAGTELATNQGFVSFVCDESVLHNRFLYYVIEGYLGAYFETIAPGTTFSEISRGKVKQEAIAFPSAREQERIATYLDASLAAIDDAVAAKRRQLKTLDHLRKSIITPAVTRGLNKDVKLRETKNVWLDRVPTQWDLASLKRISEIQTGLTLGKIYEGSIIERPYLRVANVQDGHLDLDDVTTIEVPPSVAARVELKANDVLMTEGGDLDKLGRGFLWHGEIEGCLHQNHIFAVRCFSHKLLPRFLTYLTSSQYGRAYFEATGKRTTNLAATNSTKVGLFPIPLPSTTEQGKIVDYLDEKLAQVQKIQKHLELQLETLNTYRKSLIHECVTGQRRVTDGDLKRVGANV